ncbi:MAG: VOC family protein [bacterium]|nr:VOC family protein [bacterium]MDE0286993.1 VOC family protein [bacterium]MDE0437360.1 VOC family protein [bacterium]
MATVGGIHGVWHFSFTVSDMDRSVEFYVGLLSFELVHRQVQDNPYTRSLVGYPDARIVVAQLAVPGRPRQLSTHDLELVQYVRPLGQRGDIGIANPGAGHLAVAVDDIHAWYDRLTAAGVSFFSEPNRIMAGVNEGGYAVYFHDPDQIVLELLQPPPGRLPH